MAFLANFNAPIPPPPSATFAMISGLSPTAPTADVVSVPVPAECVANAIQVSMTSSVAINALIPANLSVTLVNGGVPTALTCSVLLTGIIPMGQTFSCSGTAAVPVAAGNRVALEVATDTLLPAVFNFGVGTRCQ